MREPVALADVVLPAPRVAPPIALADICTTDAHARASHAWGSSYSDVVRGFRGAVRPPARRRRAPARGARRRGAAGVGGRRERRRRPLRRRDERQRRRAVRGPGPLRRRAVARPRRAGPRAADRRGLAGGEHPGRRDRPGAREATARAGPHAALLSAVLRALDARRLDRDPRGRALRDRRDAHRRPRRVRPRDHADRARGSRDACPGRARARRRTACCSARRASSGSSPRPGCACARGRRRTRSRPCASRRSPPASTRCARSRSRGCGRPTAASSIAEEARMTGASDGTAALLVLGFEGASEAIVAGRRAARPRPAPLRRGRRRVGRGRAAAAVAAARARRRRRRRRRVADGVLPRAVPARRVRRDGDPLGDVRDGDHVGALRALHAAVTAAAREAIGPGGRITCRISHVYPDGPAPYFTVLAPARRGEELEQWAQVKAAASDGAARRPAGRSRTTTPSGATTGPGMTASARSRSPPRCGPPRRPSTRPGC